MSLGPRDGGAQIQHEVFGFRMDQVSAQRRHQEDDDDDDDDD